MAITTGLVPDNYIKISVVIPIANLPLHRQNVLDLILTASEIDAEIILVFDGATQDEILEMQGMIVDRKKDIIIISTTCNNPGGSRNLGKANATGKWITFWDCDDSPNAKEVRSMIIEADSLKCEAAIGRFNTIFLHEDMKKVSSKLSRELTTSNWQFAVGLTPGIWRFAFITSIAKNFEFPELRMGEDQVFIGKFFSKDRQVHLSKRVSYNYMVGRNSQLTRDSTTVNDKILSAEMLSQEFDSSSEYFYKLKFTMLTKMYLSIFKLHELPIRLRIRKLIQALNCMLSNPNLFFRLAAYLCREKAN